MTLDMQHVVGVKVFEDFEDKNHLINEWTQLFVEQPQLHQVC